MPHAPMNIIQARAEAQNCLMCEDAPCACNCPAGVDARSFIRKIRFDNLDGAVRHLRSRNVMAASCAYVCPTGSSCAKDCTAKGLLNPIEIGKLQRFVTDYEMNRGMIEPLASKKDKPAIAVVGSGPAGLGAAAELAVRGHAVKIFEAEEKIGGVLRYHIPSFRLPEEVLDFDVEFIKKLGVEIECQRRIEDPARLLSEKFSAVYLATGLWKSKEDDLIGSDLNGAYRALDFLRLSKENKLPELGRRVLVIGGGDTAMDSARTARERGAESIVVYRRTQSEMPAYEEEVEAAWRDGVEFYFRVIPRAVVGKDRVEGLRCVRVRWHKKTAGMKQGYDVEGSEFVIGCDSLVIATGQIPESTFKLRTSPSGMIAVSQSDYFTSNPSIFAGGDVVTGGGTAARAVGMGKLAAAKISEYVAKEKS